MSVVLWHAAIVWTGFADRDASPGWLIPFKHSPVHALWAGQEAVILFFVLSGFVLALPFCAGDVPAVGFLIRRVLRIYPAYALAVLVAIPSVVLTSSMHVGSASAWLNGLGGGPVTPATALNQLTLIGVENPSAINPVVWSLVVEMRISLVFPVLVWIALRHRWQLVMPAAALVSAVDARYFQRWDALYTVAFVVLFIGGIYLARHRAVLVDRFGRLPIPVRILIVLAALTAYSYHYVSPSWAPQGYWFEIWMVGLGSAALIVATLYAGGAGSLLRSRALLAIGRSSYSIYLFHALVLVAAIRILTLWVPLPAAELAGLALVIPLALITHRYVELPGIRLGQRLTARARFRPAIAAPMTSQDEVRGDLAV